jgi:hypothetical protein
VFVAQNRTRNRDWEFERESCSFGVLPSIHITRTIVAQIQEQIERERERERERFFFKWIHSNHRTRTKCCSKPRRKRHWEREREMHFWMLP